MSTSTPRVLLCLLILLVSLSWAAFPESTLFKWTPVSGPYTGDPPGVYPSSPDGVYADGIYPRGRECHIMWIYDGELWFHGGDSEIRQINDMWKYSPALGQWAWVAGVSGAFEPPRYSATPNDPQPLVGGTVEIGAREGHGVWVVGYRAFIFGGQGRDVNSAAGYLNDLFVVDMENSTITWLGGNQTVNQPSSRGTKGVPGPLDQVYPGTRWAFAYWVDSRNMLWMHAGLARGDGSSSAVATNDLWMFNPDTLQWTWVAGPDFVNSNGVQPPQMGVPYPDTLALPAARDDIIWWASGDMFYSAYGYSYTRGWTHDLWRIDVSDPNNVTFEFCAGSLATGSSSGLFYENQGVYSAGNEPGARLRSFGWTAQDGTLYLYGGRAPTDTRSDLWQFCPREICGTHRWVYLQGSITYEPVNLGPPVRHATPGGRERGVFVNDPDDPATFWFQGGTDRSFGRPDFGDLWTLTMCANTCGNSALEECEECDDGDRIPGDGCNAVCGVETGFNCTNGGGASVCVAVCGDSLIVGGEQCDDGNSVSGDGCSSTCQIESPFICAGEPSCCHDCGNSIVESCAEQCDGTSDCTANCTFLPGVTTSAPSSSSTSSTATSTTATTSTSNGSSTSTGQSPSLAPSSTTVASSTPASTSSGGSSVSGSVAPSAAPSSTVRVTVTMSIPPNSVVTEVAIEAALARIVQTLGLGSIVEIVEIQLSTDRVVIVLDVTASTQAAADADAQSLREALLDETQNQDLTSSCTPEACTVLSVDSEVLSVAARDVVSLVTVALLACVCLWL